MGPRRFVIGLAGLLSACGLIVGPASASCAFFIEWNGVGYSASSIRQAPRFGPSLGEGTVPACDDTGSSGCSRLHGADEESIALYRLPGIIRPWRCGDPIPDLPGTVVHEPGLGSVFAVRFQGDRVRRQYDYTAVAVDAKTTVTGFDEYGLPHIKKGDTLRATVRERTAGERYQVVADSIER